MKLAFSTLGCPDWSWREIYATAKDLGLNGIEIRGVGDVLDATNIPQFYPENLNATVSEMKRANLSFSMLASNAVLSDEKNIDKSIKEAKDYIDLAKKIGCEYIRVLCDNSPSPKTKFATEKVAEVYADICDYAKDTGVLALIETNSYLADSNAMLSFIKRTGRANAFVLWDVHHPYRFFGEKPEQTANILNGLIKYVHVKDSIMENGITKYRMMGYGDVPVMDCLKILKVQGYDGFVSLEWVKRWSPDLQEPGIVFSHYVNYMQFLMNQI